MQAVNPDYIIDNILNMAVSTLEGFEEQQRLNNLKLILYMSMNGMKIYRDDDAAQLPDVHVDKTEYVISQFRRYLLDNGRTKGTVENYRGELFKFFRVVQKSYKDVKYKDVRTYISKQRYAGNKDNTINNKIHVLSSFYGFVMRYGNAGNDDSEEFDYNYDFEPPLKNPMDRIEIVKTEQKYQGIFEDEEIVRIRDECKKVHIEGITKEYLINMRRLEQKRSLAIVDLLLSSGMRVCELVALNIKDIRFSERECVVYGKGRKERPVYMNGDAKVHMEEYLELRRELSRDNNPALFVGVRKPFGRLSKDGVRRTLHDIEDKVDVQITPHKFRRTYATRLLESGVPLDVVADLMGHSSVDMTKKCYTKYSKQRVKNAYRQAMA